jgi:hypothetical protein
VTTTTANSHFVFIGLRASADRARPVIYISPWTSVAQPPLRLAASRFPSQLSCATTTFDITTPLVALDCHSLTHTFTHARHSLFTPLGTRKQTSLKHKLAPLVWPTFLPSTRKEYARA